MRKLRIVLGGMGLVAVVAAQPAAAQVFSPIRTACSPGALRVCAAVSAASYQVGTSWRVQLKVWNLYGSDGLSYTLTAIGLYSAGWQGHASLLSGQYVTGSGSTALTKWGSPANDIKTWGGGFMAGIDVSSGGQGIQEGLVGCNVTSGVPPRLTTCLPTSYVLLDFSVNQEFSLAGDWQFRYHAQEVAGTGCSLRVDSQYGVQQDAETAGECGSVIPEPITMVLLGSGLAGVGGAGLIRRRKKDGDVTNG